jgi:purine-binding chemotaxis protein CheW
MTDAAIASGEAAARAYLTFRVDGRLYALPAETVTEVVRIPPVARVPQSPRALLGLANLRGAVLPVVSARGLLGCAEAPSDTTTRALVLDARSPVAVVVDRVEALVRVDADRVETRQAVLARVEGEALAGAFRAADSEEVAKVLDVEALLAAVFARREQPRPAQPRTIGADNAPVAGRADEGQDLITFEIARQEYGLPLAAVREIVQAPETLMAVPRSEALVLGVMPYRDTLLPLLSLRGLLGFPIGAGGAEGREKVVVTAFGDVTAGLVVDRTRTLVSAPASQVEPTPPMLAARAGGETQIKAIYRGDGGRRLVSILATDQLFSEDVMQRLEAGGAAPADLAPSEAQDQLQFLVFALGAEEFGLPIEVVDEVARVPEQIARVPKMPKFLEGVVNLRGQVLPVIDQRRRFDMPPLEASDRRRLIVLRAAGYRAGVIVDSVSEVLRCAAGEVEEAPDLTGEATRLVRGVVNVAAAGRLVLLLDPAELLTRAERGLLKRLEPTGQAAL